jgi:hypothetical protein
MGEIIIHGNFFRFTFHHLRPNYRHIRHLMSFFTEKKMADESIQLYGKIIVVDKNYPAGLSWKIKYWPFQYKMAVLLVVE